MSQTITLEIPDFLADQIRKIASATNQRPEDIVLDWISQAAREPNVQRLADEDLLALCDAHLEPAQQEELSDLLTRNRESKLGEHERPRLDELMQIYRSGLNLKARALREAVARGLKAPLSEDAA